MATTNIDLENAVGEDEFEVIPTPGRSLKDRLHDRRQGIQAQNTVDLPVPGYESILVARYRPLPYQEQRKLGRRQEKTANASLGELYVAVDSLINSCVDLLEIPADGGEPVSLGRTWTVDTVRDLFGLEGHVQTARQALLALYGDRDMMLLLHYGELMEWHRGIGVEVDNQLIGELGTDPS